MSIGNRIKEERERMKLSQTSFADLVGVHRKSQANYETDQRNPNTAYMKAMATAGIDVGYIITGERFENIASTATELAYLRQCRALAAKGLAQQGLDGLNFLRISNGIEWPEQQPATSEEDKE
jgi:transcriptional regulator with XRE-family HTH domain